MVVFFGMSTSLISCPLRPLIGLERGIMVSALVLRYFLRQRKNTGVSQGRTFLQGRKMEGEDEEFLPKLHRDTGVMLAPRTPGRRA
jgi:hypothetical protein